ncbi:MAG: carbamoyltransferase HypF [Gammaproteobacteria bacterium]|nr:carbamoyltransferase HypF [Gammaproteobacteria bacterium]
MKTLEVSPVSGPGEPGGEEIRVRGIVQGVGFRPTVWRLAHEMGLAGEVLNDGAGVLIRLWGAAGRRDAFVARLAAEAPPLARIDAVERASLEGRCEHDDFRILASGGGAVQTHVAPDAATCPACRRETLDPADRRYRYPFTNCTHCGPRLSIVRAIPYDRANTSMDAFPLCPACGAEYADPADRRFHAQPNACPACGPRAWLSDAEGKVVTVEGTADAVAGAARLIGEGRIVAIKGVGGFHLACDAASEEAVNLLRARKRRYGKAFALMARDVSVVRRYAVLSAVEEELMAGPAAPIVVLDQGGEALATGIAPGQTGLGFMLPYTPLHHLFMAELEAPVVLTSGNRSDEPQCTGNAEALERLAGIADAWLLHDRDIVNRLDDSVARVAAGRPRLLRRARGYVPAPLTLPAGLAGGRPILAMGGELKNTFCLNPQGRAVVSQHMGDLEEATTLADYRRNLTLYRELFRFTPEVVAVDEHPDYLSTQEGVGLAAELGAGLTRVQHHHAHCAAVMAEAGLPGEGPAVLGVALDGLGYGRDGTLWGGEFLVCDYRDFRRVGRFAPVAMPGGTQAIREPWRNTFAHLMAAFGPQALAARYGHLEPVRDLYARPVTNLLRMVERGLNSPRVSSAGRLCDAVAAALGIQRERVHHEGQAAMELEALAAPHFRREAAMAYPFTAARTEGLITLQWAPLWEALLGDLERGVATGIVAARFHQGMVAAVATVAGELCEHQGLETVVLGGGVFQNRLLLEGVHGALEAKGLRVLSPQALPANDGGLSCGQLAVAVARGD